MTTTPATTRASAADQAVAREAREAALHYVDVNAACPHPFDSLAGRIFREEFLAERKRLDRTTSKAKT